MKSIRDSATTLTDGDALHAMKGDRQIG